MGIWEFDNSTEYPTKNLERVLEIDEELRNMGFEGLDEEMVAEIGSELRNRADNELDKFIGNQSSL